ncbi:hypothetical protein ACP4OV_015875 [Aristida adscensionis]
MGRGSAAEHMGEKAETANGEEESDGQRSKIEKSRRKEKKGKRGTSEEHADGRMSKIDAKKGRKEKKENKEIETTGKLHVPDAAGENVGPEHSERSNGEGEHDVKCKKGKRKRRDCETDSGGSAGDQIVPIEDEKRRKEHSVSMEEGKQIGISKMRENKEGEKKSRQEGGNVGQDVRQNTQAGGDANNSNKENKRSKDENDGGEREELKVAQRKDKGKRVSFADAVEVFSFDGGDEEVGWIVDSTPVHGQRFTSEEDAKLMEAILRDNISWEAISDKLTTRSNKDCCLKWYQQLASPLVKEGMWADTDDYLLVEALQKIDAVCIEDIDWESLLDHRSGELCRQRWNQMVRVIGGHREKPFIEQVEVLSRRYCPETLDYRKPEACE